ncbi:hypothetical protein V1477_008314 [Vespula maculifrons]|uniref:Uncharacterized protein n=1 Tax=Vespula maculifrons TaxID=7453 RepID=A0ABD2CDC7_VESMC
MFWKGSMNKRDIGNDTYVYAAAWRRERCSRSNQLMSSCLDNNAQVNWQNIGPESKQLKLIKLNIKISEQIICNDLLPSQPDRSSGGAGSLSGGYSSKLEVSIGARIRGLIGGSSVRSRRPSQLKPTSEWRRSSEKFKHKDAEGPIVGAYVVASIENNFRCDIFRRTAECPCLFSMIQSLGKSKVHDFNVSHGYTLFYVHHKSISHDTFTI